VILEINKDSGPASNSALRTQHWVGTQHSVLRTRTQDSALRTQDSALRQDSTFSTQDSNSGLSTQDSALGQDLGLTRVWTVGHSTRSAEEFNEILRAHNIQVLVDVRTFPGSRRYPQFNKGQLSEALQAIGIEYVHAPKLGGRRRARRDSVNTAWRNEGFRGYADHMETEEFQKGIEELLELASDKRTTIMCAESLWWRCHRSLIADHLKATGIEVIHILNASKTEVHPFTSAARIVNGKLSYRGLLSEG
jgi:hypothetical protein